MYATPHHQFVTANQWDRLFNNPLQRDIEEKKNLLFCLLLFLFTEKNVHDFEKTKFL